MSTSALKKVSLWIFVAIGGGAIGFGVMSLANSHAPERKIASLHLDQKWETPALGKHLAPIRVHINLPEKLPDSDLQSTLVTGYVNLSQPVRSVFYQWTLPQGTALVSGEITGELTGVSSGQTVPFQISLLGFSKEKRRTLSLEAYAYFGEHKLGNSTAVISRPEDSIESIAAEKMRSRQEFDKERSESE